MSGNPIPTALSLFSISKPPTSIPELAGYSPKDLLREMRANRADFYVVGANQGEMLRLMLPLASPTLISAPHIAHEILVEKSDAFEKAPSLRVFAKPLLGNGLLTTTAVPHKRHRRMMAPYFLHKSLSLFAPDMLQRTEAACLRWQNQDRLDLLSNTMELTLEIVGSTLFGSEVRSDSSDVGEALTEAMDALISAIASRVPLPPWIPTPTNLRGRRAARRLNVIIGKLVAQREEIAKGQDPKDILAMLLHAEDEEDGGKFDAKQIRDEAMTLFLAGHETTANAVAWTLHLLALNPDANKQVVKEIDGLSQEDILKGSNMPLLISAIKESMRLWPPAYVLVRQAQRPIDIGGISFKKGTLFIINIRGIHRRGDLYERPLEFDLQRLVHDADRKLPKCTYMPFSTGPRNCIGMHFAMLEAQIVLATLLKRLRLSHIDASKVGHEALITLRPTNLWMHAEARSP